MAVAAYGFYIQSAPLLLICLFCMGTQSTLFGPLKYAILPDYLNDKELIMGNSLIESGTFIAILLGQILGTAVAGVPPYIVGGLVLLVAIGGTMTSLFMPSVPAKMPDTKTEWNIIKGTNSLIREAAANRPVFTSIIGISWFWFVGSVYTTQLPTFTQIHLGGNDNVFNLMLALFSIGIAIGSVLCAKLSHERLILGLVTIGTLRAGGLWIIAGVADPRPTLYRIKRHYLVFIASPSVSDYARHVGHRLFRRFLLRTALHLAANCQQRNLPCPRRRRQQHHQWCIYGVCRHFERGFADVVRQYYAAIFDCCRG